MATLENVDKKIVLYGAGVQNVQLVYSAVVSVTLQIEGIADKDPEKQGNLYYATKIASPDWLKEFCCRQAVS